MRLVGALIVVAFFGVVIFNVGTSVFSFIFGRTISYPVVLTAKIKHNGQMLSTTRAFNCRVHDQRGTIAVGAFSTRAAGEVPYFLRPGGGIVILSGFDPCIWKETAPVSGQTGSVSYRANLVSLDSVTSPSLGKITQVNLERGGRIGGLEIVAMDVIRRDGEPDRAIAEEFPFLRGDASAPPPDVSTRRDDRARTFIVSAFLYESQTGNDCGAKPLPAGEGWVGFDFHPCKGGRPLKSLPTRVATSLARINVDPAAEASQTSDVVFMDALIRKGIARRPGSSDSKTRPYEWRPRICVLDRCREAAFIANGAYGYYYFHNAAKKQIIQVMVQPGSVFDLVKVGM